MKIAVLREGRANLALIWAAAHRRRERARDDSMSGPSRRRRREPLNRSLRSRLRFTPPCARKMQKTAFFAAKVPLISRPLEVFSLFEVV